MSEREKNWKTIFESYPIPQDNKKVIWFHAASMGEFEQAKPVIEELKGIRNDLFIVCSFYSPSGYQNQKKYKFADSVVYLPFDTKKNAMLFINKIQPDIAIFVRYEIWHNFLSELKNRKIPVILICATIPGSKYLYNNIFFRSFTITNYNFFEKLFTVGTEHTDFFIKLGVKSSIETLNDTRFDRVNKSILQNSKNEILPKELFKEKELIFVAGSSWETDENIILESVQKINSELFKIRIVFVPHEPTEEHLRLLKQKIPGSVLLSKILTDLESMPLEKLKATLHNKHIIVDSIGKLLRLYSLADFAYIGGAFGAGVHSVVEPAGYFIPLACGPKMRNSPDAVNLRVLGALQIISNEKEMYIWLNDMLDITKRNSTGKIAGEYVMHSIGSTERIVSEINELLTKIRK